MNGSDDAKGVMKADVKMMNANDGVQAGELSVGPSLSTPIVTIL